MMIRTFLKMLGLATTGLVFASAALAHDVTLRFGHYAKPGDTAYLAAEHFKWFCCKFLNWWQVYLLLVTVILREQQTAE